MSKWLETHEGVDLVLFFAAVIVAGWGSVIACIIMDRPAWAIPFYGMSSIFIVAGLLLPGLLDRAERRLDDAGERN